MSLIKNDKLKNLFVFLCGCVMAALMLEVFLSVYNPFGFRIKGNKVILYPYKRYVIQNKSIKGADSIIRRSNNSIGLRGMEPPKDLNLKDTLSIITVGGSTTECYYLSDGDTWPDMVYKFLSVSLKPLWLNNAGLDGQSTYGHLVMLEDYILKLKPKVVIFLIGINDVALGALNKSDKEIIRGNRGALKNIIDYCAVKSEICASIINMALHFKAKKFNAAHGALNLKLMPQRKVSSAKRGEILKEHEKYLPNYGKRLKKLIDLCRQNDMEPVFITQPSLYGKAIDPISGVDLGVLEIKNDFLNSRTENDILNSYNRITARMAEKSEKK